MKLKILFLDVNQSETASKISKINTFQQYGIAKAFKNIGNEVYIGRFNKVDYYPLINYEMNESENLDLFDLIFISNYTLNFFGGVEISSMTKSFYLLNKYKGKIVYLLSDFEMKLKQYNCVFKSHSDWNGLKGTNESDYLINKYDIVIHSFNLEQSKKYLKDKEIDKILYFPIQYSSLYENNEKDYSLIDKDYDLIYCGSFRSGRREEKMMHYFFDNNLKTALFGSIKEKQFKANYKVSPDFLGRFNFDEISINNQRAIATIVIGDKSYNNNFFTLRILEGIRDDLVVFIDNDYDEKHILFDEFNYVKNKDELLEKINLLKSDENLYKEILSKQKELINEYTDEEFENQCRKISKDIFE